MAGNVIIITGTTGSGKTTTCQAWTRVSEEPYLLFGFDLLVGTLFPGIAPDRLGPTRLIASPDNLASRQCGRS